MSGSGQHFLPQFLMKGFSSRIGSDDAYVWVCRKGGNIFETNIKNIGKEKEFYGPEGIETVDEKITDYENKIHLIIDGLRSTNHSFEIHDPSIADFVSHIAIRTKHLRGGIADSFESLYRSLVEYLQKPANVLRVAKKMIVRKPPAIVQEIEQQMAEKGISRKQRKTVLFKYIEDNIEQLMPKLDILGTFEGQIRKAIADGHNKGLEKRIIPNWTSESFFAGLNWFLLYFDQSDLILGDLGILMRFKAPKLEYRLLPEKDKPLDAVFLPISAHHLIVATFAATLPKTAVEEINLASARNSKEFFIGPNKKSVESCKSLIGANNPLISDYEQKLLFKKIIQELY